MNELDETVKHMMRQSFLDGYLQSMGLYSKDREKYTPLDEKIYQHGLRFAHEYVLSTKEDNGNG